MSQYRQKPIYGAIILASAFGVLFNAAMYRSRGDAYGATLSVIAAVVWMAYGIWALRMTYLRVEPTGLTIRAGGMFGSGRFVAWSDVPSATLNRNRLNMSTVDGRTITLRLSWLGQHDRRSFLDDFGKHVDVT